MNITVRKANRQDIDAVDEAYTELLLHEREYGAYTVWQLGIYPTRETAERGFADDGLYVAVADGEICGSMIVNQCQPEEYKTVSWVVSARPEEVLVIHLLCVRPSKSGLGVGRALVRFAMALAETLGCRAVRLDTGAQNLPARSLYQSIGFDLVGVSAMKIGGLISHRDHLFFEWEVC